MTIRRATHAGSWYTDDPDELDSQLTDWLSEVKAPSRNALDVHDEIPRYPISGAKALIGPHAGFSYSGPTAAWAYACVDRERVKRVFILGPSHHAYIDGCATSGCSKYATPVGDLPIDTDTTALLDKTGRFEKMSRSTDEDEHSIEMHLPYVRKIFEGQDIQIVPVLVGSINVAKEAEYGKILAPYLADPATFFVVSSDFCHWGTRFRYTYYQPPGSSKGQSLSISSDLTPSRSHPIYASITEVDKQGMRHISLTSGSQKTGADAHKDFAKYLRETSNTVCGRHPIGVLLGAIAHLQRSKSPGWSTDQVEFKWTRYAQSSACVRLSDSSVSYASGYLKAGPADTATQ